MAGTFVIESGKSGRFRFNLLSGNHQVILSSQTYDSKAGAEDGIDAVRRSAADDAKFERKTAKDGSAYFVVTATNGQTIGRSEMYSSPGGMERGIKSVEANAPRAKVVDHTH